MIESGKSDRESCEVVVVVMVEVEWEVRVDKLRKFAYFSWVCE